MYVIIIISVVRVFFCVQGVSGLFKGLLTPVTFSTPICAVQFWAVTMGRKWQISDLHGIPT